MKIKKTVYTKTFEEAHNIGEANLFYESQRLNNDCASAIVKAIDENYKDYCLNTAFAIDLINTYGYKRVSFVLAGTIQSHRNDIRISDSNREWAKSFIVPQHSGGYIVSHPCMIDSLANTVRKMQPTREKNTPGKSAHKKGMER